MLQARQTMSSTSPTTSEHKDTIPQANVALDIAALQPEDSGRPRQDVGAEGDAKVDGPTSRNADEETSVSPARPEDADKSEGMTKVLELNTVAGGSQQETKASGASTQKPAAGNQLDPVDHQDEVLEGRDEIRRDSTATEDMDPSSKVAAEPTDTHEGASVGHTSVPMSKNPTETSVSSATPTNFSNQHGDIPTSSFVRVSSPAAGSSSSILGSAPKKFSTVNINKKFLGKTAASPVGGVTASSTLGPKPSGGLGSLSKFLVQISLILLL